ncbi:uncharacterized protein LOC122724446 [Manihot esculenta]|uniref:uncharacterized protein LOC122724446 n=1 Tax=Manihot esculenta TaxID=3983 RepID=UPI001CC591A7|nr:uncharacterized protein LOC122724446 [Manihot esculenta]
MAFSYSSSLSIPSTMAQESNSADHSVSPLEDASSPFFLHHFENHNSIVITPELVPNNFPSWRRSFQLTVPIRNKQGYLDSTVPKPSPVDPLYLRSTRCNNLIVAWLLRSISPSIASTNFYLEDAKQIWDKLHRRFSKPDDSQICHL